MMHETARHAIHSFETLSVSVDTVEAMQQQVIDLSSKEKRGGRVHADASDQTRIHLASQLRMLRGLFLRSQSNKERLQNEIALVGIGVLTMGGENTNVQPGVQFDRPARQSCDEGLRRSSEA
jgi:hypothetical protein